MRNVDKALSSEPSKIEVEGIFSSGKEKKKKRKEEKENPEKEKKSKKKKVKKEKEKEKVPSKEHNALEDIDFWITNNQDDVRAQQPDKEEIAMKKGHKKKKDKKGKKEKHKENGHGNEDLVS